MNIHLSASCDKAIFFIPIASMQSIRAKKFRPPSLQPPESQYNCIDAIFQDKYATFFEKLLACTQSEYILYFVDEPIKQLWRVLKILQRQPGVKNADRRNHTSGIEKSRCRSR
jgi:hypothetical protein